MKKVVLSVLGLSLLAACSGYDYYKTDVRYRQDGDNCIYYYTEKGKEFSSEIRNLKDAKQIVYKNVKCEDLYMSDSYGYSERNDRKAIIPAYIEEKHAATTPCGCKTCGKKQVLKNKYVIVPSFAG